MGRPKQDWPPKPRKDRGRMRVWGKSGADSRTSGLSALGNVTRSSREWYVPPSMMLI